VVHLIHRESWQSALSIYESKAKVTSFCLELSKKLDMRYESPSLRVDLTTAAVTGESNHHRSVLGNTQSDINNDLDPNNSTSTDGNPNPSHDIKDAFSRSGSVSTTKSESNVYHDIMTMMYNAGDSSSSTFKQNHHATVDNHVDHAASTKES
jgi:hypothetical protein